MLVLAMVVATAVAASPIETRSWSRDNVPAGAALVPDAAGQGRAGLRIVNAGPSAAPLRTTVAVFSRPALATPFWSVRGRVRTDGVVGQAYLEMWSTFPDGRAFFSRTLSGAGPTQNLEGTQAWRDFSLPFQSEPGHPAPVELKVNVVLPGTGTVELGPLELHQHDSVGSLFGGAGAWFSGSQAGLAGGIAGSLLGALGAAIGWLSSRGRARSLVLGALVAMIAGGTLSLAAAGLAAWVGQPRDVWYSLALFGLLCAVLPAALLRTTASRYREAELRRMRAIDV